MLDLLKTILKQGAPAPTKNDNSDTSAYRLREQIIPSRRLPSFGRHIAFLIDDRSIQMAAVSHFAYRRRLLMAKSVVFPVDMSPGEERDSLCANEIKDFIEETGGRYPQVSLAVSGQEVAYRMLMMPRLKRRGFASALKFKIGSLVPFPKDNCIFDSRSIRYVISDKEVRVQLAVSAATKKLMSDRLKVCSLLDINVVKAFHSSIAVGEILETLPDFDQETRFIVINVSLAKTEISFYRGAQLEFNHVGSSGLSISTDGDNDTRLEFFGATLATEFQTSLDYYTGHISALHSFRVCVTGDSALVGPLLQQLNQIEEFVFVPFPTSSLSLSENVAEDVLKAAQSCLAAVSMAACQTDLPNLLPEHLKQKNRIKSCDFFGRAAAIFVALALLVGGWSVNRSEAIALQRLQSAQQEIARFEDSEPFDQYRLLRQRLKANRSFLDLINPTPSYVAINLKEISLITPPQVRLLNYDLVSLSPQENLTITGVVRSNDPPPEIILAEFVENLKVSTLFENVILSRHVKRHNKGAFEITFSIKVKAIV